MHFVLFGDGRWATLCLDRLLSEGHRPLALFGRSQPTDGALEAAARNLGIPLQTPSDINAPDVSMSIRALHADIGISVSYDQIFALPMRESARLGLINCHAGKLPFYRGRNVVNWALINNEKEIGITIHQIDAGIDTGDILLQRTLPLTWDDTYGTVLDKIYAELPPLLVETLRLIERGDAVPRPQAHLKGSYFRKRKVGDETLDWTDTSLNLYNKVRAITHPGPGARATLDGKTLVVWKARYALNWPLSQGIPGKVVASGKSGIEVKTGDSTLLLETIEFEGDHTAPVLQVGKHLD